MTERDFEAELNEAIEEVRAYKRGEIELRTIPFAEVASPQEIRRRLNLSQSAFAAMMGVSVRTLQDWEQGRHQPNGSAHMLLRIADQQPEVFLKLR